MKKRFDFAIIGALCVLLIPSLFGIFHSGFFVSDDGSWMIIRLSAFYSALVSGQFPARFLPQLNVGFGYPVADFLYPLFLYIGSLLHLFRVPFILTVKLLFAVGIVSSGFGMYFWLKSFFKQVPSLVGALVFVYFPYHMYDLYSRGSLGEIIAFGVVPWIFLALQRKKIVTTGLLTGALILSHNTLALFFLPVIILYAILQKQVSLNMLATILIIGLGASCFFWLPALYDKQFTVFDRIPVANPAAYFVSFANVSLIGWISVVIVGGILCIKKFWKANLVIFFLFLFAFSLTLSLPVSAGLWQMGPLVKFVQFPFRFLSLIMLAAAFLSAFLFENIQKKTIALILFSIILIFSSVTFLFPSKYTYFPDLYYATNGDTTTVQQEYMPIWVKSRPIKPADQIVRFISGDGTMQISKQKGTHLTFTYSASRKSIMQIAFVYFPGWNVVIDKKNVVVNANNPQGLMQFDSPAGNHMVEIYFAETPLRLFSDIVSGLTLIGILLWAIKNKIYAKK